jgi:imidazolonepropionase-like amidohydrolase
VEQLAAAGVDALKGYVGLSRPMLDSLVAAGRDHELPVIADLGPATSSYATQAGVAARAHTPTVTWTDEAIAAMVDRGVASITTLAVVESFSRRRVGNLRFLEHPLIARTTPPWFLEELRAAAERQPSSEEAERLARILQRLDTAQANVRRMHEAGVLVVAGTDAPYPGVFQGEGIHRELELLVEAGLTPLQAISTATYNAARLMDADAEWGRIAPGLAGDLVVVRGDPTVDVAATREIMAVIRNGVVLDREALTFESLNDPGFRATGSVAPN